MGEGFRELLRGLGWGTSGLGIKKRQRSSPGLYSCEVGILISTLQVGK
jgi:hypothetical protein